MNPIDAVRRWLSPNYLHCGTCGRFVHRDSYEWQRHGYLWVYQCQECVDFVFAETYPGVSEEMWYR